MKSRPIVFLHIPKCAGQSVRILLSEAFPKRRLFPGQNDQHLSLYSRSSLQQFDIFSGHFSWSLLDFLSPDAFVFTVLRDPVDRVISFYQFLRNTAQNLSPTDLNSHVNRALRAAKELPFDEFLSAPEPEVRGFIDSQFDNFYTYYFSTRMISGRYLIRNEYPDSNYFISENLIQNALTNIRERVRVYHMNDLDALRQDLSVESDFVLNELPKANMATTAKIVDRKKFIDEVSNNSLRTEDTLHLYCQFDAKIMNSIF